ncbi:MAG: DMT family transporter [Pseudomonadota bacterium]
MMVSMGAFNLNDGFMKLSFEQLGVSQALFMRGCVATVILLAAALYTGAWRYVPARGERGPLALRAVGEIFATGSFMVALAHMPIANATAVLQAAPLAVTMAAATILGERVGWRRWSAIGVGFIGMLIILRPGTAGFDVYAIAAVIAVVFMTVRDLGTRAMSRRTPTVFASLMSAILITVGAAVVIPFEGWRPVDGLHLGYMLAAGTFVFAAYFTNVLAVRTGEISAVAPFRYTVLLFALGVGYLFFGDVPDRVMLLGAAIVVAAGLYTLWREQQMGHRFAAAGSARPFGGGVHGRIDGKPTSRGSTRKEF